MKQIKSKLLALLIASVGLLTLPSCEGPMGRPGIDGQDGTSTYWDISTITINENDWKKYEFINSEGIAEAYLYCDIEVTNLTQDIARDGAVLVSLVAENEYNYPLPYTSYYKDTKENFLYSETLKYDYSPKYVRIYSVVSDLALYRPVPYTFKITLIY